MSRSTNQFQLLLNKIVEGNTIILITIIVIGLSVAHIKWLSCDRDIGKKKLSSSTLFVNGACNFSAYLQLMNF